MQPSGDARLASRFLPVAVAAALAPIVVATARAVDRGWLPVGDNAFFAIRAADVLTSHPPLLGTWTSNSLATGIDANNPGPLFFDLLSLPVGVLPGGAGLAVGVAILNALTVIGIALLAHRRGGPLLGILATAVSAGLCWAMGSELLFDPWQPHAMLLPFLCFLLLIWSLTCGDLVLLPVAAGVGSLLLQTHLSYAVLVPVLAVWGVLGLVLDLRRRRREHPQAWPSLSRRFAVWGAAGAGVGLVGWVQPLIEQFTAAGDGNLTRLADTLGESASGTVGYSRAAQLLASVTTLPPWWLRPSFGEAWLPSPDAIVVEPDSASLPSVPLAAGALAALAALIAWCLWDAHRRDDRVASSAVITAAVALVAGMVTAGQAPIGLFGLAPHQFRWLWPLAAFTAFAIAAALARRVAPSPVPRRALVGGFSVAAVVLSLLNLPTYNQGVGPSADDYAIPVIRDLGRQMGTLEGRGTLLVDLEGEEFASPYSTPIMAELQRRDIPFVVKDPTTIRQLGPTRRFTGSNADATLTYRVGNGTRKPPPGSRRVALHEALSASEREELDELRARIAVYLAERDGLELNRRGRAVARAGKLPQSRAKASGQPVSPEALLASREVLYTVQEDLLVLDEVWAPRFERYARLQDRFDEQTVALFLGPVDGASAGGPP